MTTTVQCRLCGQPTTNQLFCTRTCQDLWNEEYAKAPTEQEIRLLCEEIQRSWSEAERQKRRTVKDPEGVNIPAYSSTARNLERMYAPADA